MKYILYRPTDQTGLGNRLRGLTLCYAISLVTGRRLLVDDYLITEYFLPPHGTDWTVPQEMKRIPQTSWRVLIQNLSPETWDEAAYTSYQTRHLSELLDEDVVEIVQGASFVDALRGNPHYAKLWASLGMDPLDALQWIGRLIEMLLARPKPKLLRAAASLKRRLGWDKAAGTRIGVQYRTFYDVGSPHLPALDDFMTSLGCDFPSDGQSWFFVTTDDPTATARLEDFLSRRGTVVVSGKKKAIHTGYSYEGWTEFLFKVIRKLWPRIRPDRFDLWKWLPEGLRFRPQTAVYAEWYVLGECSALYSTFTTFSEFAAARLGNQARLVRFDPDTRVSTTLKETSARPLVSVVTVSFNSLNGLKATHASLPDDKELEYLLLDGVSTDGTESFLANSELKYEVTREPDRGIFDAMNKGILRARGQYVLFMNCGDRFFPGLDWDRVKSVLRSSEEVLVGGLDVDDGGRVRVDSSLLRPSTFLRSSLPHQAAFIPRRFFLRFGIYDETYSFSADQEWFFRTLMQRAPYRALDAVVACYQSRGLSDQASNKAVVQRERSAFLQKGFGFRYPWVHWWTSATRDFFTKIRFRFRGGRP